MAQFILEIPDDYSQNLFGPFNTIEEGKEFLINNYPKKVDTLKLKESRANPRNLLVVYFMNSKKNAWYVEGKNNEYTEYIIATLHEVNTQPCPMIMKE